MHVLGIETSCDETAVAVLRCSGGLLNPKFSILSNGVASQITLHARWGGVVPNLAKREHLKNLPLVLAQALKKAKIKNPASVIDSIAVTVGPGLEPALWTGINFARDLALLWKKPLVRVNHMEGHITSVLLKQNRGISNTKFLISSFKFPAIALLVSGGHTELVLIRNPLEYKVMGETLDDAAGEAFDKVARMLGLGYPGGPIIAKLASQNKISPPSAEKIYLPRPMLHSKDFNFSFSGLKTAVLYLLRDIAVSEKFKRANYSIFETRRSPLGLSAKKLNSLRGAIAKEFQQAVIDVLIAKTMRAAKTYKVKSIILGGGVAANKELRTQLQRAVSAFGGKYYLPPISLTGDNAAMIAAAGYLHAINGDSLRTKKELLGIKADATLRL